MRLCLDSTAVFWHHSATSSADRGFDRHRYAVTFLKSSMTIRGRSSGRHCVSAFRSNRSAASHSARHSSSTDTTRLYSAFSSSSCSHVLPSFELSPIRNENETCSRLTSFRISLPWSSNSYRYWHRRCEAVRSAACNMQGHQRPASGPYPFLS